MNAPAAPGRDQPCCVLFALLLVNVNFVQVVRADELRDDPRNTRVLAEEYDRERGRSSSAGNAGRAVGARPTTR